MSGYKRMTPRNWWELLFFGLFIKSGKNTRIKTKMKRALKYEWMCRYRVGLFIPICIASNGFCFIFFWNHKSNTNPFQSINELSFYKIWQILTKKLLERIRSTNYFFIILLTISNQLIGVKYLIVLFATYYLLRVICVETCQVGHPIRVCIGCYEMQPKGFINLVNLFFISQIVETFMLSYRIENNGYRCDYSDDTYCTKWFQ